MILWPSTLSKIGLFCYNDCMSSLVAPNWFACRCFFACKTNEGVMGVFLMFELVVLAAESAESLRVPHSV